MTEDGDYPAVGSCFEELAEGEEFDVYDKYSQVTITCCSHFGKKVFVQFFILKF
jgi:hypothetical protein